MSSQILMCLKAGLLEGDCITAVPYSSVDSSTDEFGGLNVLLGGGV